MSASGDFEAGSIPAVDAVILWSTDIGRPWLVTEVFVCARSDQPEWTRRLNASAGACSSDWLGGSWRKTPQGLFLEMAALDGFTDKKTKIAALKQFAKIEGQDWAIDMLLYFGENVDD